MSAKCYERVGASENRSSSGSITISCAGPVARQLQAAHDHDRHALGLAAREVGGARRSRRRSRPGSSAARSRSGRSSRAGRGSARSPATPIATSVVPWRNGRPNESVTITPTSTARQLEQPVAQRAGARVGIDRQQDERARLGRVRVVDAGRRADEPVLGLGDHERRRARGRSASPRAGSPRPRAGRARRPRARRAFVGGLEVVDAHDPALGLRHDLLRDHDDVVVLERRPAPAISAARSSPCRISGRPCTGRSEIIVDAGDADARVRLVAAVQVDDHRGQALERAGARERAGVERAAGDELAGELERELLRVRVVAADRARPPRAAPRRGSRRRSSAARRRRAPRRPACTRSARLSASGSGSMPTPFSNAIALATESSGVVAERVGDRARGRRARRRP